MTQGPAIVDPNHDGDCNVQALGRCDCRRTDDEFDDDVERSCWTCGGDGYVECEDWECLHPKADRPIHIATCDNCGGSGEAKDVWRW